MLGDAHSHTPLPTRHTAHAPYGFSALDIRFLLFVF